MDAIRLGDTGEGVQDVQRRLVGLGVPVGTDVPGEFGPGTEESVRAFQQARGLVADGVVGLDTWRSLVEAGWSLGDRNLYLANPMLRGDDVRDLQERLNLLGFDSGRVDGIFGPDTVAALREFQANVGIHDDGVAGHETVDAVRRLHRAHQAVPAFDVRERHRLGPRGRQRTLAGVPVLVDAGHGPDDPGFASPEGVAEHDVTWAVASRIHGRLAALGARPVLARGPRTTPTSSDRAALANSEDVELIVSIHCNGLPTSTVARGVSASYYGTAASSSERGRRLADLAVQRISETTGTPNCRAHASTATLLRESRAIAVVVELGFLTHPEEGRLLADPVHQGILAACITDAVASFLATA